MDYVEIRSGDTYTFRTRDTYPHLVVKLPVREVSPGIGVALLDLLGKHEFCEVLGKILSRKMVSAEALVMPEGKAVALLHVLGRECRLPTYVFRKGRKPYMEEPVSEVPVRSVTTGTPQTLVMPGDVASALRGKRVVFVDDVISSGDTLRASESLLQICGAELVQKLCVFTEGETREDVTSLGHLPLFRLVDL